MGVRVKTRAYNSPARRQKAEATRAAVLEAAERLFLEHGYHQTTTAAIGREAGVSEASVFATFGSKASLLASVVRARVTQSAGTTPLVDRPEWQRFTEEPDPRAAVERFAAFVRRAHDRTWRLLAIVRSAAESDDELARVALRAGAGRRDDCEWFCTTVLGMPRRSAATRQAVDALWALSSVDLYRLLTQERGWSGRKYETWLAACLCRELGTD